MFAHEQLSNLATLLAHLHKLTGLKFALLDENGTEIYTASCQSAFCMQLKRAVGAHARCVVCDREMITHACRAGDGMQRYRCHAGLVEVAVPVMENGRNVATVLFGQLLDYTPVELQWQTTRRLCSWHPAVDTLRAAFYELRTVSDSELESCAQIVHACVSEARLQGMPPARSMTDGERLLSYIDRYYASALTLDLLCHALSIGKTKLCALAKQESGLSVSRLIASRRVSAAREMLENTSLSIQQIAEAVGIPDYNYFSKVFKSVCGMTPSAYRQINRK